MMPSFLKMPQLSVPSGRRKVRSFIVTLLSTERYR
jgi:hypothetical protein